MSTHACQSERTGYLHGPACVTVCVCAFVCACVRLRWLILRSGETGPDGAWRLAVFLVTELMMLFMKFIDPICIAPRVPSPISMSVLLLLPPLSIYVHVPAPNPTLHIQRTHNPIPSVRLCSPLPLTSTHTHADTHILSV